MGGDGVLFVTIPDAQMLNTFAPSEAILLDRADKADLRPAGFSMGRVGAVMVALRPGADPEQVRNYIRNWGDVAVLTRDDEEDILLNGRLWRLRIQILAFVVACEDRDIPPIDRKSTRLNSSHT